jgi:hypothetical protein
MISEIKKELSGLEITPKTLRNFGLLFFAVFGIAAGMMLWKGNPNGKWPAVVSLVFLATGIFSPGTLRHPYRLWMSLAMVMGWFMTRIILVAAFWLIMTPSGWLLRAMGKDLLDEKIQKGSPTYWKKHEPVHDKERYKKQF